MTDAKTTAGGLPQQSEAWQWPEETWRRIVNKVRAGRSLKPDTWKGGARCAVALSFDSDHETQTLRWGHDSPGRLSAGEYSRACGRAAHPHLWRSMTSRLRFSCRPSCALLYPDEQRRVDCRGARDRHSQLDPRAQQPVAAKGRARSADACGGRAGEDYRRAPGRIRTPSWDFSPHTLSITREMGLLYDLSLMADDDPYEILEDGKPTGVVGAAGRVDQG